jgi:hypothetical protein
MTKETFNKDVVAAATPHHMAEVYKMINNQRKVLINTFKLTEPPKPGTFDFISLYAMAHLSYSNMFTVRQLSEIDIRYGSEFTTRLNKWYDQTGKLHNTCLNSPMGIEYGKLKDYLTYLTR